MIKRKINCKKTINLIKLILNNFEYQKGTPLGNLTSQFFANVYLNELDYFVKSFLKAKYYIRYVDDFIVLHKSKFQLEMWKKEINSFLDRELKIGLHPEKSKVISLSKGVDFVGFRNFYYFKILRRRSIKNIHSKKVLLDGKFISREKFLEVFEGWKAYALIGNSYKIIRVLNKKFEP